ncbi:hypothetical protein LINPERHAP1_LOCUS28955 [Linum perenne]
MGKLWSALYYSSSYLWHIIWVWAFLDIVDQVEGPINKECYLHIYANQTY